MGAPRRKKWGLGEIYTFIDNMEVNENGCKIWKDNRLTHEYGFATVEGEGVRVHRLSLERKLGRKIKEGFFSCHYCDVPRCVNPDHLFEGTPYDNMHDCIKKGRIHHPGSWGDRNGSRTHPESRPKGMDHYATKLSDSDLDDIKNLYYEKSKNKSEISRVYGVTSTYVRKILAGRKRASHGRL